MVLRNYFDYKLFVPADHIVKIKVSEKRYTNILDLKRKLKKLWNMKMTVIPILDCTLGSVFKDLEMRLEVEIR